jgi:serine/threonine protein kinase
VAKTSQTFSTFFASNVPIGFKSFDFLTLLGKGSFGKVFLVRYKETGQYFACKVLNKKGIQRRHLMKYALSEVRIMHLYGKHPFILNLHYAF